MAEFASSGLFSFEKDKKVLLGREPFEFRLVEKIPVDQKFKVFYFCFTQKYGCKLFIFIHYHYHFYFILFYFILFYFILFYFWLRHSLI